MMLLVIVLQKLLRGKVGSQPFTYIYHVPVYNIGIRKAEADQIIRSIGIYDNWEEVPLTTEGRILREVKALGRYQCTLTLKILRTERKEALFM
jgi:hypothetical protein